MNPFNDFELDMVKITNEKMENRSCDDPLNGSTSGSSVSTVGPTFSCTVSCSCLCPSENTLCATNCAC